MTVASNLIYRVCEYLDGGAQGIVAPYVETVEQAKTLVGAAKLRPLKGKFLEQVLDNIYPGKVFIKLNFSLKLILANYF